MDTHRIKEYFRSVLDVKPGEGRIAGLMFLYNFLLLVTLYLLKPVRDSMFLVELGPLQLPYVFIFTALVVIPISVVYSRFSVKMSLGWVIHGVTIFLAFNLIIIWWLLQVDSPLLYYIFYIWVSIYSILITSQFWLLANALFNATQAKRIFTLLSLAAIAGAIAGGEITGFLVDQLGIASQSLLLIGAGILFATVFLVQQIRRETDNNFSHNKSSPPEFSDETSYSQMLFKDILQSRHLMLITGIIAISVITTTIIDYQFKTMASQAYPTDNALTIFMGHFYGRVSIVALFLQLFLSSKFIDRRGVGGAVAILPTILLVGSAGLFIWPGLIAAVLLRGADQSLKHSLDRTGRELLFIPVDIQLKKRTKVFIDLFVDNGAQGLAGVLLLLLTLVMTLSVQHLSIVVAGLLICWISLAIWVRRSYVDEFRESVEEQVNNSAQQRVSVVEPVPLQTLIYNLGSNDADIVLESLFKLEQNFEKEEMPVKSIQKLFNHPAPDIRKRAIHILRTQEIEGHMRSIAEYLADSSPEVRLEAARYIYHFYNPAKYNEGSRLDILRGALNHNDIRIRAAAFGLIAKDGGPDEQALVSTTLLEKTLTYEGPHEEELKIETALLVGTAYDQSRRDILQKLLYDSSDKVIDQALMSAGKSGDRFFIHILLRYLDSIVHRKTAQQALALYGVRIFGTLFDYMNDDRIELARRIPIPSILILSSGPIALEVLQIALNESMLPVRHEIIKSLNKIKQKVSSPSFNEQKLKNAVYEETRRYALLKQAVAVLKNQSEYSDEIFRILEKEIAKSFENIFRLLGVIYNADDIYNAYKSIKSNDPQLISEGVEFFENLIEWDVRKYLFPIVESIESQQIDYGEFEDSILTVDDAKNYILSLKHSVLQKMLQGLDHSTSVDENVQNIAE